MYVFADANANADAEGGAAAGAGADAAARVIAGADVAAVRRSLEMQVLMHSDLSGGRSPKLDYMAAAASMGIGR